MKRLLLSVAIAFFSLTVKSQTTLSETKVRFGVQATQLFSETSYSEANVLVGIFDDFTEISAGPLYRRLYGETKHDNNYYGGTLYAQSKVFYPVLIILKTDFVYGNWYKREEHTSIVNKKKGLEMMPTVGLGYAINKDLAISVGYNYFVYNPVDYVKTGNNPFQNHGVSLAIKYSLPGK